MKNIFTIILLVFSTFLFGQHTQTSYEEVSSFYPNYPNVNEQDITWGKFTVPENWESPTGIQIKLAVATLKNTSNKENAEAIVMIEGGPGASASEGIVWWLNNPLRVNYDIILVDVRGTGFSEPRLCPDLGKEFLAILAKNQTASEDEKEKAQAAMRCKETLIAKGINTANYTSANIAKDMHALKEYFKYENWNVYGVSYGTQVAKVYTKMFPNDVKSLVLDSPIADISQYYTQNTSNYVQSLEKVFKTCKDDPACNEAYPELEAMYYKTIQKLKENPITVSVDKSIVPSETFTYNAEDFKIAIHQALYQYKLIEVIPMLIYQFHDGNEDTLSALVAAFSGALSLDYGVYYCVTCNEAIPENSVAAYDEDVKNQKSLSEGLSFYKSDFVVCDQWNRQRVFISEEMDSIPQKITVPTLIYTGGFDPITPTKNGTQLANELENAQLIEADALGHAAGFTGIGFQTTTAFFDNPTKKLDNGFKVVITGFIKDIHFNGGVANMGNSLGNLDMLLFLPLGIALFVCLIAIFIYIISFVKKEKQNKITRAIRILLIVSSILSILIILGFVLALQNVSSQNFYILAFGLPENYAYLFNLLLPFVICVAIAVILFFVGIKQIKDRSVLFSVLFSNILVAIYLFYWGMF